MDGDELLTINQRVKKLRETLRMTQIAFARSLAISQGYLSCIEVGQRDVHDRVIKLIRDTFHVSEDWLRAGAGEMFPPERDEKFAKFIALFDTLKPAYQDFILNAIDQFLKMDGSTALRADAEPGGPPALRAGAEHGGPAALRADAEHGGPPARSDA